MESAQIGQLTATFGQRFAALLLDAILLAIVSLIISRVVKGALINAVNWPLAAGYYTWCEGRYGQTLGKRAVNIKVVDDLTGQSIGCARALLRFVVSWVSFIVFLIGYLAMLVEPAQQTWHDRAARSLVVPT